VLLRVVGVWGNKEGFVDSDGESGFCMLRQLKEEVVDCEDRGLL